MPDDENYIDEACWVGWKQKGMKKKGNRMVPNCVKEDDMDEDIKKMDMGDVIKDFYKSDANMVLIWVSLRRNAEEMTIAQNSRVKKKNSFHRRRFEKVVWQRAKKGDWVRVQELMVKSKVNVRGMWQGKPKCMRGFKVSRMSKMTGQLLPT